MIDTNLITTASNMLIQAGYTIKAAPVPVVYTGLATSVVTACLAILAVIASFGRAFQAWKTDRSALKALFLGTNTPTTPSGIVTPTKTP